MGASVREGTINFELDHFLVQTVFGESRFYANPEV